MKERFGAKDPRSMQARFHIYTAGSTLTAQQPMNNIVRVTAAERNENLVPSVFGAVKRYATVGEICGVLREVYGEYVGGKDYF